MFADEININIENITPVIPLNIYQFWHSSTIPDSVKESVENIKNNNPEFNHFLYNENEAREFIKNNFPEKVLRGYDLLIPYALKCDLWRYCILYLNGGIYLDAKYTCYDNFKLMYLTECEYFCKDIKESGGGIYNAFMICNAKNNVMLRAIDKVLDNIENDFYGRWSLEPTGPLMLKSFFTDQERENLKLNLFVEHTEIYIRYNTKNILRFHPNYRKEQQRLTQKHWAYMWVDRNIYVKS